MPDRTIFINARFLTQHITGVQRYAHELVQAIDDLVADQAPETSGLRFVMLAPPGPLRYRPELEHIALRQIGRFSGHAWEQLSLPFFCRDGLLFCPGNTAPLHSLLFGRVVVTVHSLSFRYVPMAYSLPFRAVYHILTPAIMRWAGMVLTVSQAERKNIVMLYPSLQERLKVVQHGGLPDAWLQGLKNTAPSNSGQKGDRPYVLFVGSLCACKNIHGVIAVAKYLEPLGLRMKIVGGTAQAFKAMSGLDNFSNPNIDFLGHIDDRQTLLDYYANAKCLLLPSLHESSALPPLEAMSRGCPVVCSNIPALQERCGDAALYCDPLDPQDIAQKTIQAATDEALRERLIQKGYQRVSNYSWERCARDTLGILRTVQ